jgi:hypothetical protein
MHNLPPTITATRMSLPCLVLRKTMGHNLYSAYRCHHTVIVPAHLALTPATLDPKPSERISTIETLLQAFLIVPVTTATHCSSLSQDLGITKLRSPHLSALSSNKSACPTTSFGSHSVPRSHSSHPPLFYQVPPPTSRPQPAKHVQARPPGALVAQRQVSRSCSTPLR